jgi:peptidoglycan/xylan/chitin deacetylase (PgdA/CDA1 family)
VVPILMYHQVSSPAPAAYFRYTVTPPTFARQMRALAAMGYETVSLDRLAAARSAGRPLPQRSVAITFDDGFADAVRHALPVLARHRFTATFFAVAGLLGMASEWTRRRGVVMPLADADTLRAALGAGCTIGSHALTHRPLADLQPADAREELSESKKRLEDALGHAVHHLAYPYGSTRDDVRQAAAESGYQTACTTVDGASGESDDLLMLPRIEVRGDDSIVDFMCRVRTGHTLARLAHRARVTMKVSDLAR